jgi:hypothetical protein
MCQNPVGCEIFWVSPLAYTNLFGTKGFVVVVVVIVVVVVVRNSSGDCFNLRIITLRKFLLV